MPEMKSLTLNGKTYDNFVDQTARSMSMGSAVIDSASGENITLTDASKYNLLELHIYGKTTQNGTPTPDAPVELESVGDNGSITVNVTGEKESQSMVVSTHNCLPGIPVTSGGNYTDANGQPWICDEIDFARGVYVQRVTKVVFNANSSGISMMDPTEVTQYPATNRRFNFKELSITNILKQPSDIYSGPQAILSNYGKAAPYANSTGVWTNNVSDYFEGRLSIDGSIASSVEELLAHLAVEPIVFIVPLAKPIETPLSEEELAAYAELHTYRDNTNISNDASAHMDVEYVMDAKKYIQNLIAYGGSSPARLTSVTIRASAWQTTADNLHSQVVTIDGVTPYSKVDLLPSVEQLAIFHNKDVAFVTENEGGVVTVYAIGDRPQLDYTMQAQITEVVV